MQIEPRYRRRIRSPRWPAYIRGTAARLSLLAALLPGALVGAFAPSAGAETCPNVQARVENRSDGLPDCRAYELVSPAQKNGSEAGANPEGQPYYAVAGADGRAIAYGTEGPIGSTPTGLDRYSVSRRSAASWSTGAALPRGAGQLSFVEDQPHFFGPSADLSHFLFTADGPFMGAPDTFESPNIFLVGEEPIAEPEWVGRPAIPNPNPPLGRATEQTTLSPAGYSANLSTVYFTYYGTLVSEDAPRAENEVFRKEIEASIENPAGAPVLMWGFYEWKDGVLSSAGILPSGKVHPFGAVPAAIGHQGYASAIPDDINNEVSTYGTRAFFVSPDPDAQRVCKESGYEVEHPSGCVPQLYVRENGEKTVLVSGDVLEGDKLAPDGPLPVKNPDQSISSVAPYVYASPDGSQAFFESVDRLTRAASENPEPKMYDFNVDTSSLTYLPGVVGPVLASSTDGSRLIIENKATSSPSLDLWERGPTGEQRTTVVSQLPSPVHTVTNEGGLLIAPARATANGSAFVFETDSPLPGGFNNGGGWEQVYRYSAASSKLTCVSCPPAGVVPSGDARLSEDDNQGGNDTGVGTETDIAGSRGLSSNGGRVFFDTPDPLVPQDINGKRDVYEWENGRVYLISSGTGPNETYFLDNSESGDDVFFATTDELVESDTDGGYDVYDAHVNGGFSPPPPPAVCVGDSCQSSTDYTLSSAAPSSMSFTGGVNVIQVPIETPVKPAHHKKTKKKRKPQKKRARKASRAGHRGHTLGKAGR